MSFFPRCHSLWISQAYRWMGTPSLAGGGLVTGSSLESFSLASLSVETSSELFRSPVSFPSESVSLCRKLPSLTGLRPWILIEPWWPLWWKLPWCCPWLPDPLPFPPCAWPWPLLPLDEVADKCGMFSGSGCLDPMFVTPTSEAFPALLRA